MLQGLQRQSSRAFGRASRAQEALGRALDLPFYSALRGHVGIHKPADVLYKYLYSYFASSRQ